MKKTRYIVQAAVIAALYSIPTIFLAPISSGQIQVRVAEALTVLPFFTPAAIPGIFVGCIIANIFTTGQPADIIFGSLASLAAAYLSHKMPKRFLVPLPPIIINAIVVGFILNYLYQLPLIVTMLWVGLGQTIACYGLGYPLLLLLSKYRNVIFRKD